MDNALIIILWLIQAAGMGIAGDQRQCGAGKSFLMPLLFGPLVAAVFILAAPERKG